jgi:hypothetical protein
MTVGGISKTLNNSNLRKNKMQSESIAALAAALSKAQADITGALKDSSNPFFKSKYADLASCWDACRKQLAANNLAVIQTTEVTEGGTVLVTTIAHSSGEWMRGTLPVVTKDNGPQAQGSGITYARRYALAAIVGLAQIDDDAEAAQARGFVNNPRGDLGQSVDAKTRDALVTEFRAAFNLDADESDIANAVLGIHERISSNHDLYVAAADQLTAKERGAIKKYITIAKEKNRG